MKGFENLKGVIFDLDNTLYDENEFLGAVCDEFCRHYSLDPKLIDSILDDRFRVGSRDIFGDWLKSFDFYTQERQYELFSLYESLPEYKLPAPLSLYKDAQEFLDFLLSQNLKLGILTNGGLKAQRHKVGLLKLEDCRWGFKIEYARSCGKEFEKPHISAFQRILGILELQADECLFIGDNPLTDIKGANNAGIYSIWLQRGYGRLLAHNQSDEKAKLSITHFDELRSIW